MCHTVDSTEGTPVCGYSRLSVCSVDTEISVGILLSQKNRPSTTATISCMIIVFSNLKGVSILLVPFFDALSQQVVPPRVICCPSLARYRVRVWNGSWQHKMLFSIFRLLVLFLGVHFYLFRDAQWILLSLRETQEIPQKELNFRLVGVGKATIVSQVHHGAIRVAVGVVGMVLEVGTPVSGRGDGRKFYVWCLFHFDEFAVQQH